VSSPQTLEFAVGEDVELDVQTVVRQGDTLTSWALQFQLFREDGTVAVQKTTGSGISITGASTYKVDLTDGSSFNLTAGRYRFETRVTNSPKRARDNWGFWYVSDNWSS
jgi:hypothetical protein